MPSDKVHRRDSTKTGSMPRAEMEPALRREIPQAKLPEILDDDNGATTGEMPIIAATPENNKTQQDEDSPAGK